MTEDAELEQLRRSIIDSLETLLRGTHWAPPNGGLITDAVIVCGWKEADGSSGRVYVDCCPPWSAEGLLLWALRIAEDANTTDPNDDGEDE